MTSPAHANLTVSLSIAATIHHHYIIALETTCAIISTTEASSSQSNNDVLVIVLCSVLGGLIIIIIILLTVIYLRKQTVSPELGSEAVETLSRRVTMRFSNATPLGVTEEETEFYRSKLCPIEIIPHELEFPFDSLLNLESIGQTTFGVVYKCSATKLIAGQDSTDVLVRMLRDDVDTETMRGFFRQVEKMASFIHDNIIQLLGVCSREIQPCMIFEFPDGGNLNDTLQLSSNSQLQTNDLLKFAIQVADAMAFLEHRRFVHRDLSTRNCMLTKHKQIKLLPFGVIRPEDHKNYYKVGHQTMLPIRWLPHNTILHGQFNTQTDVWSFGVFLWELFSRGKQPFEGQTNEDVVKCLREGFRLPCPGSCPTEMYELMVQCWMEEASSRPTFSSLHASIKLIQL